MKYFTYLEPFTTYQLAIFGEPEMAQLPVLVLGNITKPVVTSPFDRRPQLSIVHLLELWSYFCPFFRYSKELIKAPLFKGI
jgi:hypothetical protein